VIAALVGVGRYFAAQNSLESSLTEAYGKFFLPRRVLSLPLATTNRLPFGPLIITYL
jgi:hypothetical protein